MKMTPTECAAALNMSRQNLHKLIDRGVISGPAIIGSGRGMMLDLEIVRRQVSARRDIGQSMGNGLKTKLYGKARKPTTASVAPAEVDDAASIAGTAIDEQIKRERLSEIQSRNRKAKGEELARVGRYTLTEDVRREMNALAARLVSGFESALTDFAADIAHRHKSDQRDEFLALAKVFHVWRAGMAERAQKAAAALPEFIPDPMEQDTP